MKYTEEDALLNKARDEFLSRVGQAAMFSRRGRFLGFNDELVVEALEEYSRVTGRPYGSFPLTWRSDYVRAIRRVLKKG